MGLVNIKISTPTVLLAIILAAILNRSYFVVILVLALTLWTRYARLTRGETLIIRSSDSILRARVAGSSTPGS